MAISTDPSVLAAASRCFDTCIPPGDQAAVKTYLLAQIAGVTDPAVVANNARCFSSCISAGALPAVQAYLSAVLAGGSTDPSTLLNAARCFLSCIPPGANAAVTNYALAVKAGGSTDPSTLANAARCFSSCIPPGMQMASQSYLMAVASGSTTNPAVIIRNASGFIGTIPDGGSTAITDTAISTWAGGGQPTPPPPVTDPLVTAFQTNATANGCIPSAATLAILNTFATGIRAQTYFTKLKEVCCCVPDGILCCYTPLIITNGATLWTMQVNNPPQNPGIPPTLANCTLNNLGVRCDFPIKPGTGLNVTPFTTFASRTNGGFTMYLTNYDAVSSHNGVSGTYDGTNFAACYGLDPSSGNVTGFGWLDGAFGNQMPVAWNGKYGYYSFNATGASQRDIYFGNSTTAHANIDTSAAAIIGNLSNTVPILVQGWDNNGLGASTNSEHYSFWALHDGLTAAESLDFFTRIQAMRVAFGTGFI